MSTARVRSVADLPTASAPDGTETFPVVQQGVTAKMSVARLLAFVQERIPVAVQTGVTLDSMAEFRSANLGLLVVRASVNGYYGAFTLGGGTFVRDGLDVTTADDGGSCIVRGGVRWKRLFRSDVVEVADFGLAGTVGDNGPILRAAEAYAAGRPMRAPRGIFLCSSGVDTTNPINLQGVGMGAGPGAASQYTDKATIFICNFANPTLFKVTSDRPSIFRDFQIDVNPGFRPATAGAGIHLTSALDTGATTANYKIHNVAINNTFYGIYLFKTAWGEINGCYFGEWADSAIKSETNTVVEGSVGHIHRNFFFGRTNATQRACIYIRNGYTVISENEILGAQYGILVDIANFPAGFVHIHDNTIEENFYNGVRISKTGGAAVAASMFNVHDNEFSSIATGQSYLGSVYVDENGGVPWIDDVRVNFNTTRHLLKAGSRHHFINGGRTMQIMGNECEELSGTDVIGISVTGIGSNAALVAPILMADNLFRGIARRYQTTANAVVTIRDQIPDTVAQIQGWGVPRDGSTAYASDGRSANPTSSPPDLSMTSGGSGAPVTLVRGSWRTDMALAA